MVRTYHTNLLPESLLNPEDYLSVVDVMYVRIHSSWTMKFKGRYRPKK
jgi:hypothetical protein